MSNLASNVKNLVQGYYNYAQHDSLPKHIKEQVALREFLCAPCLANGKCLICKCNTPAMFYSPAKEDSNGKWGKFLDETQWKALKNYIDSYKEFIDAIREERPSTNERPLQGADSNPHEKASGYLNIEQAPN